MSRNRTALNRSDEIAAGRGLSEGQALSKMLDIAGIDHKVQPVFDRHTLTAAIHDFASIAASSSTFPVLHIAVHGDDQGIGLTSKEHVTWRDLYQLLTPVHAVRFGAFLLCMSSCHGLAAITIAAVNIYVPLFGVIGTQQRLSFADAAIGFAALYHLLNKGHKIPDAVNGMKNAAGNPSFQFVQGSEFLRAAKAAYEQAQAYQQRFQSGLG